MKDNKQFLLGGKTYINNLHVLHEQASKSKFFDQSEWDKALANDEIDMYTNAMLQVQKNKNIPFDLLNNAVLSPETKTNYAYALTYSDNEKLKPREIIEYSSDNTLSKVTKNMTDRDYFLYVTKYQSDLELQEYNEKSQQEAAESRNGWQRFWDNVGYFFADLGVETILGTIDDAFKFISSPLMILEDIAAGEYENLGDSFGKAMNIETPQDKWERDLREEQIKWMYRDENGEIINPVWKGLHDITHTIGQQLVYAPLNIAAPGLGNISFYTVQEFGASYGQYYKIAKENNLDINYTELMFATGASTVAKYYVEKFIGKGFEKLGLQGTSWLEKLRGANSKEAGQMFANSLVSIIGKNILGGMLSEGTEEVVQDISEVFIFHLMGQANLWAGNKSAYEAYHTLATLNAEDLAYTFLIAGLTGMATNVAQQAKLYIHNTGKTRYDSYGNKLDKRDYRYHVYDADGNEVTGWKKHIQLLTLNNINTTINGLEDTVEYIKQNPDKITDKQRKNFANAYKKAQGLFNTAMRMYGSIGEESQKKVAKAYSEVVDSSVFAIATGQTMDYAEEMNTQVKVLSDLMFDENSSVFAQMNAQLLAQAKQAMTNTVLEIVSSEDSDISDYEISLDEESKNRLDTSLTNSRKRAKKLLKNDEDIKNITIVQSGNPIFVNGTAVVSKEMLDSELSDNDIQIQLAFAKLTSHILYNKIYAEEVTRLGQLYKQFTGDLDKTDEELKLAGVQSLFNSPVFFKFVVYTSSKDAFKLYAGLVTLYNESGDTVSDSIKKQRIANVLNNINNIIVQYAIDNISVDIKIFNDKLQADILKGRNLKQIVFVIMEGNITPEIENFIRSKLNDAALSIDEKNEIMELITSSNKFARQQGLRRFDDRFNNVFTTKYNGKIYLTRDTIPNNVFNAYLESKGITLENIIENVDGKYVVADLTDFMTSTNYRYNVSVNSVTGDLIIIDTRPTEFTLEKKMFRGGVDKSRKFVTKYKTNRELLHSWINVTEAESAYGIGLDVSDVIYNPNLLNEETRAEFIKEMNITSHEQITPELMYEFLKIKTYKNDKNSTILLKADGEFSFAEVASLRKIRNKQTILLYKVGDSCTIKDIVKNEYALGTLGDVRVEVVADYGYGAEYDSNTNTIYIGEDNLKEYGILEERIMHEYSHAVQFQQNGNFGFDPEWLSKKVKNKVTSVEIANKIALDIASHVPGLLDEDAVKFLKQNKPYNSSTEMQYDIIFNDISRVIYYNCGEIAAEGYEPYMTNIPFVIKDSIIIAPWGTKYSSLGINSSKFELDNYKGFKINKLTGDIVAYSGELDIYSRIESLADIEQFKNLTYTKYFLEAFNKVKNQIYKRNNEKLLNNTIANLRKEYSSETKAFIDSREYDEVINYIHSELGGIGKNRNSGAKVQQYLNEHPDVKIKSLRYMYESLAPKDVSLKEFMDMDIPYARFQNYKDVYILDDFNTDALSVAMGFEAYQIITIANQWQKLKPGEHMNIIAGTIKPSDVLFFAGGTANEAFVSLKNFTNSESMLIQFDTQVENTEGNTEYLSNNIKLFKYLHDKTNVKNITLDTRNNMSLDEIIDFEFNASKYNIIAWNVGDGNIIYGNVYGDFKTYEDSDTAKFIPSMRNNKEIEDLRKRLENAKNMGPTELAKIGKEQRDNNEIKNIVDKERTRIKNPLSLEDKLYEKLLYAEKQGKLTEDEKKLLKFARESERKKKDLSEYRNIEDEIDSVFASLKIKNNPEIEYEKLLNAILKLNNGVRNDYQQELLIKAINKINSIPKLSKDLVTHFINIKHKYIHTDKITGNKHVTDFGNFHEYSAYMSYLFNSYRDAINILKVLYHNIKSNPTNIVPADDIKIIKPLSSEEKLKQDNLLIERLEKLISQGIATHEEEQLLHFLRTAKREQSYKQYGQNIPTQFYLKIKQSDLTWNEKITMLLSEINKLPNVTGNYITELRENIDKYLKLYEYIDIEKLRGIDKFVKKDFGVDANELAEICKEKGINIQSLLANSNIPKYAMKYKEYCLKEAFRYAETLYCRLYDIQVDGYIKLSNGNKVKINNEYNISEKTNYLEVINNIMNSNTTLFNKILMFVEEITNFGILDKGTVDKVKSIINNVEQIEAQAQFAKENSPENFDENMYQVNMERILNRVKNIYLELPHEKRNSVLFAKQNTEDSNLSRDTISDRFRRGKAKPIPAREARRDIPRKVYRKDAGDTNLKYYVGRQLPGDFREFIRLSGDKTSITKEIRTGTLRRQDILNMMARGEIRDDFTFNLALKTLFGSKIKNRIQLENFVDIVDTYYVDLYILRLLGYDIENMEPGIVFDTILKDIFDNPLATITIKDKDGNKVTKKLIDYESYLKKKFENNSFNRNIFRYRLLKYYDGTIKSLNREINHTIAISKNKTIEQSFGGDADIKAAISLDAPIANNEDSRTYEESVTELTKDEITTWLDFSGEFQDIGFFDEFEDINSKARNQIFEVYRQRHEDALIKQRKKETAEQRNAWEIKAKNFVKNLSHEQAVAKYLELVLKENYNIDTVVDEDIAEKLIKERTEPTNIVQNLKHRMKEAAKRISEYDKEQFLKVHGDYFNNDLTIKESKYKKNGRLLDVKELKLLYKYINQVIDNIHDGVYNKQLRIRGKEKLAESERKIKTAEAFKKAYEKKIKALNKVSNGQATDIYVQTIEGKIEKKKRKAVQSENKIKVSSRVKVPEAIEKIMQYSLGEEVETKAKEFTSENQVYVRTALAGFIEDNAEWLSQLTQQDIDDIVNFYLNGDAAIDTPFAAQYYATEVMLLTYILKQSERGMYNLDESSIKAIWNKIDSTRHTSAVVMGTLQHAYKLFNAEEDLSTAMYRKWDVYVSPAQIKKLQEALKSGDRKIIRQVRAEVYEEVLTENRRVREEKRKQRKDTNVPKDTISLKRKRLNNALDNILKFERAMMLSGPGTIERNLVSNIMLGGFNIKGKHVPGLNDIAAGIGNRVMKWRDKSLDKKMDNAIDKLIDEEIEKLTEKYGSTSAIVNKYRELKQNSDKNLSNNLELQKLLDKNIKEYDDNVAQINNKIVELEKQIKEAEDTDKDTTELKEELNKQRELLAKQHSFGKDILSIINEKELASKQWKLVKTKVDSTTKTFIQQQLVDSQLLKLIGEGFNKYDPGKFKRKQSKPEDMFVELITTKLAQDTAYDVSRYKRFIGFIMKGTSDRAFINMTAVRYFGKMLQESNIDLNNATIMDSDIAEIFVEAYTLAAHDYMHKNNLLFKFEEWLNNKSKSAYFVWKHFFPFAGTAFNWYQEGLKFSPLGLINSIYKVMHMENQYNKLEEIRKQGDKGISSQFTKFTVYRDVGKGIIGSVGYIAAAILALIGIIKVDEDDDKYKLHVGNLTVDVSEMYASTGFILGAASMDIFKNIDDIDKIIDSLSGVLNVVLDDSIFGDVSGLFRYSDDIGGAVLNWFTYNLPGMFVPNFIKTITGIIQPYEVSYSNGFLGRLERWAVSSIPGYYAIVPKNYDPYTGKLQLSSPRWYIKMLNKLMTTKIDIPQMSDNELMAISYGVKKTGMTGKFKVNGKDVTLNHKEVAELNKLYGERNNEDLTAFFESRTKYEVEDTNGKRKKLYIDQMSDEQIKSVIERIMSNNANIAKISALISSGKYKYYANDNEYQTLIKAGIKENVYRKSGKLSGFIEIT